jgi:DNA-binding MarR family transcriptional regulator
MLEGRAMHEIFFATKRAFHGVLRVMREPLLQQAPGLTPARFDLLYALRERRASRWSPVHQSLLRRDVGVCRSVISRMLRSLEKLGWVRRRKSQFDGRKRWVMLTRAGRACIRAAMRPILRTAERLVHRAICFGQHRKDSARLMHTDQLEAYLRGMRQRYRDRARLYYSWHPDD